MKVRLIIPDSFRLSETGQTRIFLSVQIFLLNLLLLCLILQGSSDSWNPESAGLSGIQPPCNDLSIPEDDPAKSGILRQPSFQIQHCLKKAKSASGFPHKLFLMLPHSACGGIPDAVPRHRFRSAQSERDAFPEIRNTALPIRAGPA